MKRVTTYEICSQGYGLGPKTRQGDGMTPEGFYRLDLYNRRSSFHLSMRVNDPNRLDRRLKRTGGAIMIHGNYVSIGCLAMTDERIEELWVITRETARRAPVAVHIFPGRDMFALIGDTSDAATSGIPMESHGIEPGMGRALLGAPGEEPCAESKLLIDLILFGSRS